MFSFTKIFRRGSFSRRGHADAVVRRSGSRDIDVSVGLDKDSKTCNDRRPSCNDLWNPQGISAIGMMLSSHEAWSAVLPKGDASDSKECCSSGGKANAASFGGLRQISAETHTTSASVATSLPSSDVSETWGSLESLDSDESEVDRPLDWSPSTRLGGDRSSPAASDVYNAKTFSAPISDSGMCRSGSKASGTQSCPPDLPNAFLEDILTQQAPRRPSECAVLFESARKQQRMGRRRSDSSIIASGRSYNSEGSEDSDCSGSKREVASKLASRGSLNRAKSKSKQASWKISRRQSIMKVSELDI